MNRAFGNPQKLPFDLRYRRFPFTFRMKSSVGSVDTARQQLAVDVEIALRAVMDNEHQRVTEIIRRLDGVSLYMMKTNGAGLYFWEPEADKLSFMTQLNFVSVNLLTLGVIECVSFPANPSGYAYTWTYMGRLCLKRLGFDLPPRMPMFRPFFAPVTVDFSQYDSLMEEVYKTEEAQDGNDDPR